MNRPLVPEDIRERPRPATYLYRAAAAHLRAALSGSSPEYAAKAMFDGDRVTELVLKAASVPATTTGIGWATELAQRVTVDMVASITSLSAGAEVLSRGLQVPLGTRAQATIPGRTLDPGVSGTWVPEGAPITMRPLQITPGAMLVPRKLMVVNSYSREMAESSLIEDIIRQTVSEAAAISLDAALFGTQALSAAMPAGLLNGVVPIPPTLGSGINAMTGDLRLLFRALVQNGAGKQPVFVAGADQISSLKLMAGPKFDFAVVSSSALAPGTIIALEPSSLVSGFDPAPEFSVGTTPALHMEDTTPQDIQPPPGPAPISPTVKSMFQTDSLALRMLLRCAWSMRAQGHVQYILNATW